MPLMLSVGDEHFISLHEVKQHANISSSTHDDELDLFLGAAEGAVEGLVGPVVPRVVTETLWVASYGVSTLLLKSWPVLSVDSVTAGGVALDHAANVGAGLVSVRAFGYVTVTYTVGRAVVPDSIRVAALIIAEHLWSTQRGSAPSVTLQGDESAPTPGMAYSIPNRATDLLRPYLLPPAVG